MPHGCSAMCRGKPSEPFGDAEQRSSCSAEVDAASSGRRRQSLPEVSAPSVREGLRDGIDLDVGQAEGLAHLADRRPRAVRVHHRDAAGRSFPWREDHVVDVLAPGGLDVDVDVGQLLAHRVDEPLERQVVTERVHVGDAGQVAHQPIRRPTPGRPLDAHRLDVADDLGHVRK